MPPPSDDRLGGDRELLLEVGGAFSTSISPTTKAAGGAVCLDGTDFPAVRQRGAGENRYYDDGGSFLLTLLRAFDSDCPCGSEARGGGGGEQKTPPPPRPVQGFCESD